jgi:hypothetical protein
MLIADKSAVRTVTSDVTMIPGYKVTSVIANIYRGFGQGSYLKILDKIVGLFGSQIKIPLVRTVLQEYTPRIPSIWVIMGKLY